MAKNEAKVKFTAETGEFNNQIKQSGTELSQLSAELKLNSEQMKATGTSVEGLQKKQKLLEEQAQAMATKTEALNGKLEVAKSIFGENSTEVAKLQRELTNAETAQVRIQSQIAQVNNEITQQANASRQASTALGALTSEINEQERELGTLKSEYMNVVLEQGEASTEAQQLASKIQGLNSELQENKTKLESAKNATKQLDSAQEQAERSADELGDGYTMLKDTMSDFATEALSAIGSGLQELATDGSRALSTLQASTGATDEQMEAFDDTMTGIYNNNFGENLQDIGDKMSYVKQVTGSMDSSELQKMTESAITLEDTFGSDFNESVRGVDNLMFHFGLSSEEAWDLFAKGSQNGLDYTGELGDNISEYGGNFQQAGYSAEEYFQLLENGSQNGAYNLDKVNDSINEAKNRIADGSFEAGIGAFSDETANLFRAWQNGEATIKDVIDSGVKDINTCTNEQEQLTMAAELFGTMGEDANLKVVKSLTTVGDSYKDVKGTMEEIKNVKYDNVGDNMSSIGRNLETAFKPITDAVLKPINDFLGWIGENSKIAIPIIVGLGVAFGILATAMAIGSVITGVQKAMALLNATMLLNPAVLIGAALAGLVAVFVTLWNTNETFRTKVTEIWEGVKGVFQGAWDFIKGVWEQVQPFFSAIWEAIKTIFSVVAPVISGFFSTAWEIIKGIWSVVGSFFSTIWEVIKGIFSVVKSVLSGDFQGAWDAIKGIWSAVTGFFSGIWDGIKGIFGSVGSWFGDKFKGAWDGIKGAFSSVGTWFSDKWKAIKNAFSDPLGTFKNIGSKMWNGLKSALSNALGLKITWSQDYGKIKGAIVKVLGLQGWPTLSFAANGAVVDTATPLLAGEYLGARHNPEIVTPENKMREAMTDVLNNNLSFSGIYDALAQLANRPIDININGKNFATATANDSDTVNGTRMTMRNRGLAL